VTSVKLPRTSNGPSSHGVMTAPAGSEEFMPTDVPAALTRQTVTA
jgi:hypothetical protein